MRTNSSRWQRAESKRSSTFSAGYRSAKVCRTCRPTCCRMANGRGAWTRPKTSSTTETWSSATFTTSAAALMVSLRGLSHLHTGAVSRCSGCSSPRCTTAPAPRRTSLTAGRICSRRRSTWRPPWRGALPIPATSRPLLRRYETPQRTRTCPLSFGLRSVATERCPCLRLDFSHTRTRAGWVTPPTKTAMRHSHSPVVCASRSPAARSCGTPRRVRTLPPA